MKVKKTEMLTCCQCGYSQQFPITSPAAPTLSACEEAEKVGWGFRVGFFSMLTNEHYPTCPKCMCGKKGKSNDRTRKAHSG